MLRCRVMHIVNPLLTSTQVEVYLRIPTAYTHLHLVCLHVFHLSSASNQAQRVFLFWVLGSERLRQLVFRLQSERGHQIPSKRPGSKAQETGFQPNVVNIQLQEKMKVNYESHDLSTKPTFSTKTPDRLVSPPSHRWFPHSSPDLCVLHLQKTTGINHLTGISTGINRNHLGLSAWFGLGFYSCSFLVFWSLIF